VEVEKPGPATERICPAMDAASSRRSRRNSVVEAGIENADYVKAPGDGAHPKGRQAALRTQDGHVIPARKVQLLRQHLTQEDALDAVPVRHEQLLERNQDARGSVARPAAGQDFVGELLERRVNPLQHDAPGAASCRQQHGLVDGRRRCAHAGSGPQLLHQLSIAGDAPGLAHQVDVRRGPQQAVLQRLPEP
jgi:hypothetical protein